MKRPSMSVGVKLRAALYALGLDPDDVDFDHQPSLAMRPVDPETGDTIPPANDWRFIVPLSRSAHKSKTFGSHVPLSSDVAQISKLKRVEKDEAAFRARLLAKDAGEPPAPKKSKSWPKRQLQGRSWPKRPFSRNGA